jgi:receptor protein-tyrosine kinase
MTTNATKAMANETPDLIQRAAERMRRSGGGGLVEKAAQRLAGSGQPAPSGPDESAAAAAPAPAARPAPARPAASPPSREPAVQLDLVGMQMQGMVTPSSERSRILEEYRIIKRPLLLKALATGANRIRNANMIMVTSSEPREGKTFTAVNLAMSIATERDLNVLLVDADMHRTESGNSAMAVLGVDRDRRGLLDVLADPGLDLGSVLLRTNVPNLSLLPAGPARSNPTELFASQRMDQVVTEMVRRYADRIIVIDTPPVLATSEASVLAIHVGQIVFVVEAEATNQKSVESSLSLLSACPNISLVLNKSRSDRLGEQFGSYAYGY